ncbi:2-dehydropantoate 2-reductase [Catellatospora sp. KI3]|uniref:ketopantoate reductase family protein n=1 Tax=Catellatospora sp. KI3 TaxID=3041620 RepID=UPI0024828D10|nr:2-dehydropantoate 2-reductase [Catellatospora sp. KI3]MDI1462383.1 2-dehydropantoate 2-reductase [Catellatospora sp. KI3]
MRFLVYGAGAVGGAAGALLHASGHETVLLARGAHLAAIQRDGLTLATPEGRRTIQVAAFSDPAEVPHPVDAVLLAMKGNDTEAALRALAATVDLATPIACLQNGVANERAALRLFPNVYGICVAFPATHLEPGVVAAHGSPTPGILDLGRYPYGADGTAREIAGALRDAGFVSEVRPDVMRWKYRKLLVNLANALDAVCVRDERTAELGELLRAEAVAVLDAAGIDHASAEEDRVRRGDIIRRHDVPGTPRGGSSSWQSLARGTGSIEADYLNGEIVLLGRLHGVAAPYNEHARRMANLFARQGRPPASLPTAEWEALLRS